MKTAEEIIRLALAEDVGGGDYSSMACIGDKVRGKMQLLVKQEGVLAGVEVAKMVLREVDADISVTTFKNDGDSVRVGDVVFQIEGAVQSMLTAERTVLNFMQRMSGIATATRFYVDLIKGTNAVLLDTRKTTPNMRYFEKMAVRIGGAQNHRFGLYDMIMLKDNHIDFAGGIERAIDKTRDFLCARGLNLKIEIETRTLDEVRRVVAHGGVDRIMLDNFAPAQIVDALQIIGGRFETEASGGITSENLRCYAETGVNYISVGALTHHIKSLDLSLKFLS